MLTAEERPIQISRKHSLPVCKRGVLWIMRYEGALETGDPGVVDDNIELVVALENGVDYSNPFRFLPDIEVVIVRRGAEGTCDVASPIILQIAHDYKRALSHEGPGNPFSDSTGRSSDECNFAQ